MLASLNGLDTRVLDVLRRVKVGLANAKRNDVVAFANEFVDLGQHHKRVFSAQVLGALTELGHACIFQ